MKHFEDTESLITVRDWLRFAVSRFNEAKLFFGHGSDNAFDEAAYLILHTLHLPLDRLEPFLDASLTHGESEQVQAVIERRVRERLPAAYLTHEAWLGEHRFYVDERVIVPRSFIAELLHEQLAPWVENPDEVTSALDLCTGSGCLAILAALAFPDAQVDAVDLSKDALDVAAKNVADYGLTDRIELIESDLFAGAERPSLRRHPQQPALCERRIGRRACRRNTRRNPHWRWVRARTAWMPHGRSWPRPKPISTPAACWWWKSATTATPSKPPTPPCPSPGSIPKAATSSCSCCDAKTCKLSYPARLAAMIAANWHAAA